MFWSLWPNVQIEFSSMCECVLTCSTKLSTNITFIISCVKSWNSVIGSWCDCFNSNVFVEEYVFKFENALIYCPLDTLTLRFVYRRTQGRVLCWLECIFSLTIRGWDRIVISLPLNTYQTICTYLRSMPQTDGHRCDVKVQSKAVAGSGATVVHGVSAHCDTRVACAEICIGER